MVISQPILTKGQREDANDTVANLKSADQQCLAIMTCIEKVIEGIRPTHMVEEHEDAVNANDNNDLALNEGDETLGSPESSEKEIISGSAMNVKRVSPKNAKSDVKLKASSTS